MISIRRRMAMWGFTQRESRRRKARLSYAAELESLETRQLLAAVSLLRDSLPGPPYAVVGTSTTVAELDGWVYFSAAGAEGTELWRTDGTSMNTQLVADLRGTEPLLLPPLTLPSDTVPQCCQFHCLEVLMIL